jgi:hypothetical protein
MSRSTLPLAKELEQGVVFKNGDAALDRHLAAAGLYETVELRLRLEHDLRAPEDPEGLDDLIEMRRTKGFGDKGKVICPQCEGAGTMDDEDDEECDLCEKDGMVSPATWDVWFEENMGCLSHAAGCEKKCERTVCPHDERRCDVDIPILFLQTRKLAGSWKGRGNSLDGFDIDKGIAVNPAALHRFLSLIACAAGFGVVAD